MEICLNIIFYCTNVYAKYVFQDEFCIANLDIDRTCPKIELVSIQNSDSNFKNYANKIHKIIAKIKVGDKNLKELFLDKSHVKVKIKDKIVDNVNIEFGQVQDKAYYKTFEIQLSNLEVDGELKLVFLEGLAVDNGGLKNTTIEISTDIVVDNSIPTVKGENNQFVINTFDNNVGMFNLS